MQTGSYFTIGTTHTVCEDYALCGENYAVISDGCSNGGERVDTDWGSRILCKAAEEQLLRINNARQNSGDEVASLLANDPNALMRQVIITANTQRRMFPTLNPYCLTATLGIIFPFKLELRAILAGDGVIGGMRRDGVFDIYHVEFIPGGDSDNIASFYIRYLIDPTQFNGYIKKFGGCAKISRYQGKWGEMHQTDTIQEIKFENFVLDVSFPINDYEYVFGVSDGIDSFYKTDHSGRINFVDVLKTLLDFPDYGKSFVERQGKWVFKQNKENCFPRLGWANGDDVSLGVVYCGDIETDLS